MKKIDKFKDAENWKNWVGSQITKHSRKPFKGGNIVGTIKEFTKNPLSGKEAFLMDDGSIVDCYQTKLHIQTTKVSPIN